MHIEYTAPAFARSEKSFVIRHESEDIGEIARTFSTNQRTTEFDVSLIARGNQLHNCFKIIQTGFKLMGTTDWDIFQNNEKIGHIIMPKGFFKPQRLDISFADLPSFSIQATLGGKGRIKDEQGNVIGETSRPTSFKRKYIGQIKESRLDSIPILLVYTLIHTFWCSFHRN